VRDLFAAILLGAQAFCLHVLCGAILNTCRQDACAPRKYLQAGCLRSQEEVSMAFKYMEIRA
jgi:hypothetical protein